MTRGSRPMGLASLLVALVLVAVGCSDSSSDDTQAPDEGDSTTTSAAVTDGPSLIYITPNPIGVNEFLALGEIGTERAAARLGGTSKTFESTDATTMRANIEAAIDEAPSIIVLTTFNMLDLAAEFSASSPGQDFILLDACPEEPATNLYCGVFREHEGAYLLGVEAGLLSESASVGTVAALDTPFIHRWSDGFAAGAMSVGDVEDTQLFVGGDNPFGDPARAKEQALSMAAQGADHILAAAAGGNGGVFEAAAEEGFFAYGVDVNQCADAPGSIVDSNLKLVDAVADGLIGRVLDGTAVQFVSFGLAEGGVGVLAISDDLASSGCAIAEHPDVVEAVKAVAQEIIDGTLVVEDPLMAALNG